MSDECTKDCKTCTRDCGEQEPDQNPHQRSINKI